MFRDRTNLYLSYRRTFPHSKAFRSSVAGGYIDKQEKSELLNPQAGPNDIEMHSFNQSPNTMANQTNSYTETVMEIERNGTQLTQRIRTNLKSLDRKYREVILPNFDDEFNNKEMKQIDDLSGHTMVEIQSLYKMINQLQQLDKSLASLTNDSTANPFHDDISADQEGIKSTRALINNLKRKFAIVAQEITGQFRDMQGRYVKYLKKDEDGMNEFKTSDVETYSRNAMVESSKEIQRQKNDTQLQLQVQQTGISEDYLLQREREIYKISQSVVEISVIFKELENIVIDQGTILDNVVYNLDRTSEQVQGADKELKKAEGYQKQTNKCKLVFFLVLLILFVLMLFMVRPRRVDHYVHDQEPSDVSKLGDSADIDSSKLEVTNPSENSNEIVSPPDGEIVPLIPVDSTPLI